MRWKSITFNQTQLTCININFQQVTQWLKNKLKRQWRVKIAMKATLEKTQVILLKTFTNIPDKSCKVRVLPWERGTEEKRIFREDLDRDNKKSRFPSFLKHTENLYCKTISAEGMIALLWIKDKRCATETSNYHLTFILLFFLNKRTLHPEYR